MPSKGVKCFTYIAVDGVEVEYCIPNKSIKRNNQHDFTTDHLEVDKKNLSTFTLSGEFSFTVRLNGLELTRQSVQVNAMTGKLGSGTMTSMDQTPSIFSSDVIICYGFYDAGPGHAGLPSQHQCYVTVTPNYEHWMRDTIPQDDDISTCPFHRMVLPAAHDIGMNSMATSLALLNNAGTGVIKELLGREIPHILSFINKLGDSAINRIAPDIIRNLAICQKDSLETILKLGARYFEFRPARCLRKLQAVSSLEDVLYFQHGVIPGTPYRAFVEDLVRFLIEHQDEIVVVQLRWDGVPADCPRPGDDKLRDVFDNVLRDKELLVGDEGDMMSKSMRELRGEKKRLVLLQNTRQISNYDDKTNATLTGESMVDKLNDMAQNPPSGHPIVLLQCQATATNIRDVVIASVVNADVSTSPILATKPVCDSKILPLLRGDTGRDLTREDGVVVLMNDFFDGATAHVAIEMCKRRLQS